MEAVREILRRHSLTYADGWCFYRLLKCPLKMRNSLITSAGADKSQNSGCYNTSFYISKRNGDFVCFYCNRQGNVNELSEMANILSARGDSLCRSQRVCARRNISEAEFENKSLWEQAQPISEENRPHLDRLVSFSPALRLLALDTFVKWRARIANNDTILIPSTQLNKGFIACATSVEEAPPETPVGLQTIVNSRQSELIITDTIVDALCANQGALGKPVIAVSNLNAFNSDIPIHALAALEQFKRIYLWPTASPDFKEIGLLKLAKLFGQGRCAVVNPIQSPSNCLVNEYKFRDCLNSSFSLICGDLLKFEKIRDAVKQEIHHAQNFKGTEWFRFPALNSILKGHRPGELTILTGSTGCGKTTFLSEYSLDLCAMRGVPTLWGSFEIHNHRLAKTMLIQFVGDRGKLLREHSFDKYADAFSMLDMYFMNFHGAEDMQRVNSAMAAAVVTHGIKHVVLDNLQFMIGMEYSNVDRFYKQDMVIHSLRRFCTVYNCHLTLVIHPRKETVGDGEPLSIQSIFGSAKASQEADNVLILQQESKSQLDKKWKHSTMTSDVPLDVMKPRAVKYLDIVKNRFDGDLGRIPLYFNKDSLSFACGESPNTDSLTNVANE